MEVFGLGLRIKEEGAATVEASLKKLGGELAKTVGSIVGVGMAFKKMIAETAEADRVQTQLVTTLKSTNGVSGQSIETLNAQAESLMKLTAFSDEAIGSAQALLLTFTSIRGAFPEATKVTLDLARALNMDLRSAAMMVGKALNDPVAGVTALRKAGVQLTDQQRKQIEVLVKQNDLLAAQKIILGELNTQVGGSAAAYRGTLGGAIDDLKNAFDDLFEAQENNRNAMITMINTTADGLRALTPAVQFTVSNFTKGLVTILRLVGVVGLALFRLFATVGDLAINILTTIVGVFEFLGFGTQKSMTWLEEHNQKTKEGQEAIAAMQEQLKQWNYEVVTGTGNYAQLNAELGKTPKLKFEPVERLDLGGTEDKDKDPFLTRVRNLIDYNNALEVNARQTDALRTIEKELVAELAKSNVVTERKVNLQRALNDVRDLLGDESQLEAERERIRLTVEYNKLLPESEARTKALTDLKSQLTAELGRENVELERRVELLKLIDEIEKALVPKEKDKLDIKRNAAQQGFAEYYQNLLEDAKTFNKSIGELLYTDFTQTIASAFGDGLDAGLRAAIQSGRLSDLWRVMSQVMLSQIANMMVNVALSYIKFATMIAKIQAFLIANPWAAVAAATAMLAFAYANGGKGSTGSNLMSGTAGGLSTVTSPQVPIASPITFGTTSTSTAVGMQPRTPITMNIIGANDPAAQRSIQEMIRKADSRGRIG